MPFPTSTRSRFIAELAQLQIFAGCTTREKRRIDALVTRVNVEPGRVLCAEGELGRECFIVDAGRAVATVHGTRVGVIERGEIIGEIGLVASDDRRSATVTAETAMRLLVMTRAEFAELRTIPSVEHEILRRVTERLIENTETDHIAQVRDGARLPSVKTTAVPLR